MKLALHGFCFFLLGSTGGRAYGEDSVIVAYTVLITLALLALAIINWRES